MNTVQLVGRLTKELDLRYTQSGTAVASFTLAVNRNFTNQQGEREADFIQCVIWRKQAENLANFTRKGSQIGIEGRIQTRNYENQQGQRVYVTEVVVNQFHLLEPKEETEQRPISSNNQNFDSQNPANYQSNVNSQYNQQTSTQGNYGANYTQWKEPDYKTLERQQAMKDGQSIDISEDQLPF